MANISRRMWQLIFVLSAAVTRIGQANAIAAEPAPAAVSLAYLLDHGNGERPVHVLFVHGMRAEGSGFSDTFQQHLRKHLGLSKVMLKPMTIPLDMGSIPSAGEYGYDIWGGDAAKWAGSQPFILRRIHTSGTKTVIVDEVNWWPLLFAVKCHGLMGAETALSGPDRKHLKLCARDQTDPHGPYYPWLSTPELRTLLSARPRKAPAYLNARLKQEIVTWGLADVTTALGPLRQHIRLAMDAAFNAATIVPQLLGSGIQHIDDQDFVVISESLGSFVVLDAFQSPSSPSGHGVDQVLVRTASLYFLANQFALLDLARVATPSDRPSVYGEAIPSPRPLLESWAKARTRMGPLSGNRTPVAQIIAFSDPSDLLTYDVPPVEGVKVSNISVRNAHRFLWLIASPGKAHTGYSDNPQVLRQLFEDK